MEEENKNSAATKKDSASPEQLNDYIKVTNPGVWATLIAVIVLLVGFCVWGVFGKLETKTDAVVISNGNVTAGYVKASDDANQKVAVSQSIKIGNDVYTIKSISNESKKASSFDLVSKYAIPANIYGDSDSLYEITLDKNIAKDGCYSAKIVTESISPFSFIFN